MPMRCSIPGSQLRGLAVSSSPNAVIRCHGFGFFTSPSIRSGWVKDAPSNRSGWCWRRGEVGLRPSTFDGDSLIGGESAPARHDSRLTWRHQIIDRGASWLP